MQSMEDVENDINLEGTLRNFLTNISYVIIKQNKFLS